jgi:UDP-GlcNAc:undecaprenyl-phosphate GlcNAc-1-phosphate transferase
MRLILVSGIAFVVSAALIRYVLLSVMVRERIMAAPVAHRWHQKPTPSFGGVPMFIAFVAAVLVGGGLSDPVAAALVIGAGVLFLTGLIDDLFDIRPLIKLAGQAAGAIATVGIAAPSLELTLLQSLIAIAWIVLIANSVNLLDNMDGLAGGTSLASLLVVLPIVISTGLDGLTMVVVAVAGATAGFLVFNVNPARVFMGDTGSLWLGLVLASTVAFTGLEGLRLTLLAAATILAVPLVDTASVIYARTRSGRSIMTGGRDHLSHRLVRLGLSERRAVLVLNLAAAVCGAIGVSTILLPTFVSVLAVITVWAALVAAVSRLLQIPVYQEAMR